MGRDLCMSGCLELVSVRFLMFSRIEDLHPLGNQFLCSITLNLYIFLFKWNFLSFSLCHLTLVLSPDNAESVALPSYRHLPSDICTYWSDPPETFHADQVHLSVSSNAPVPSAILWFVSGYALLCPCLLCTGEPRPGHRAYWDLADRKDHCPEPADNTVQSIGF